MKDTQKKIKQMGEKVRELINLIEKQDLYKDDPKAFQHYNLGQI